MTKPVLAAAAMILVEEARIGLDDPVERWLPELANRRVLRTLDSPLSGTVPAARSITLRDLLTLRAGIGVVMAAPGTYPIQTAMTELGVAPGADPMPFSPDEFMARIGRLPLVHQPGERWLYHTAYDIAAVLIARETVQLMMTDHLDAHQKAASPFYPGFWDDKGWGFGGAVILRPDGTAGIYTWSGGAGTVFTVDPARDMVTILLIQRLMNKPDDTDIQRDFLTLAYQAAGGGYPKSLEQRKG